MIQPVVSVVPHLSLEVQAEQVQQVPVEPVVPSL